MLGEIENAGQGYAGEPAGANEGVEDGRHSEGLLGSRAQYFASDVPRPPRVDHVDLKKEAERKVLKKHNDCVAKLKWARQLGLNPRGFALVEVLSVVQRSSFAER